MRVLWLLVLQYLTELRKARDIELRFPPMKQINGEKDDDDIQENDDHSLLVKMIGAGETLTTQMISSQKNIALREKCPVL